MAADPERTRPPTKRRRALHPAVVIPAVFLVLGLGMWGLPAALGTPILRNSNLIQNFPLRVLVGVDLAHGHLPLWDPYIWVGTTLLAGFNAGAAYPLTWLFAVLPRDLAWVVNQASGQVIGACGILALSRCRGRSWTAGSLAALAYGFGGFVVAQNVHIDLVLAAGWLPWCLVGLERLANRPADRSWLPWVAVLAGAGSLLVLTGSPEPIIDGALVVVAYAVFLWWRTPARRAQLVGTVILAAGIAALGSAAQLLPGVLFQLHSQRAGASYAFFSTGSLGWGSTLTGIDPALFGTTHPSLGGYVGPNALATNPEIAWYIGAGALVAACALLARAHRKSPAGRERWFWYGVVVVGLLLALGGSTPLGHLEVLVPVYNGQRMLVRNLLEVDVALAVIFADWIDVLLTRRRELEKSERLLVTIPALASLFILFALAVDGPGLLNALGHSGTIPRSTTWPILGLSAIPALMAVVWALIARHPRAWSRRRFSVVLACLCVVDLGFYDVVTTPAPLPNATVAHQGALADALASRVNGTAGRSPTASPSRVAFFDPGLTDVDTMDLLGQPDLTILRNVTSVNGNGALVSATYDDLTAAQEQLHLYPQSLSGELADHLDIGLLVSPASGFIESVHYENGVALPTPTLTYSATAPPPPTSVLVATQPHTWYLGRSLDVKSIDLPVTGVRDRPRVRIGLLLAVPHGSSAGAGAGAGAGANAAGSANAAGGTRLQTRTVWLTSRYVSPIRHGPNRGSVAIVLPSAVDAIGVTVEASPGHASSVGQAVIDSSRTGAFRLDGPLVDTVTAPQWHPAAALGPFAVFDNTSPSGAAFLVRGTSGRTSPGSVRVLTTTSNGTSTFMVRSSRNAVLVRSEVAASGWSATIRPGPHAPLGSAKRLGPVGRPRAVGTWGVLQSINVPAGTWVVTFTYSPKVDLAAIAASAVGWLVVVLFALYETVRRLRRRSTST
ncbi:MAG: hypothetical protein M0Z95_14645 [Actinomycetota bacterium]|jgi:hypothetical protein|nr:hypothetical protein [Actinomycetota bacterium]